MEQLKDQLFFIFVILAWQVL